MSFMIQHWPRLEHSHGKVHMQCVAACLLALTRPASICAHVGTSVLHAWGTPLHIRLWGCPCAAARRCAPVHAIRLQAGQACV